MSAGVYCITNRINLKMYIGQSQNIESRWAHEKAYASFGSYMRNAFKKYGADNFLFEKLITFDPGDPDLTRLLDEHEIYYIDRYETTNSEHGYNMALGGSSNRGWRQSDHCKRTLSAMYKGRKLPDNVKKRISEGLFRAERKMSAWNREQLDKAHSKAVRCIDTGEVFKSASELARILGCYSAEVCDTVLGKQATLHGKRYEYVNPEHRRGPYVPRSRLKPVRCIDTGIVYQSLKDVYEQLGIDRHGVQRVCNGKAVRAGKLRWEWVKRV